MKPSWDKLMKEFKDSATTLIADVDCTAAGEDLCSRQGVEGYPTIKFGDPSALEDYDGGRDYEELKKFADELKPKCSPFNMHLCEGEEKQKIADLMDMPDDELAEKVEAEEKKISDAEAHFTAEVEKLQTKYEELNKEKEDAAKAVKEAGLGLMKAVQAKKKQGGGHDEL